jgi:glycosyltransferase involved in cell wall biosynthesis
MKIGIILYPYGEKNPGGLARTILEWTRALIETDTENEYIVYLKNKPATLPSFSGTNWSIEIVGGGLLWHEMLRFKRRSDVYLFQTAILPLTFSPPSVVIIQDFPYLYLNPPSFSMRILWFVVKLYHRFSICKADALIAVSEATKKDLIQFFGVHPEKITGIYGLQKHLQHTGVRALATCAFLLLLRSNQGAKECTGEYSGVCEMP